MNIIIDAKNLTKFIGLLVSYIVKTLQFISVLRLLSQLQLFFLELPINMASLYIITGRFKKV